MLDFFEILFNLDIRTNVLYKEGYIMINDNMMNKVSKLNRINKIKFLAYLINLEKQEMLNNQEPVSVCLQKDD